MAASLADGDAATDAMASATVQERCCGCADGVAMAVVAAADPENAEEYGIPLAILRADSPKMSAIYYMDMRVLVRLQQYHQKLQI